MYFRVVVIAALVVAASANPVADDQQLSRCSKRCNNNVYNTIC
jgi:hypothetical protein